MARPLEFDRHDAITRAVAALWECGFGSISSNELADRMGIARSSFYNTFGSKADLLEEVIVHYTQLKAIALQQAAHGRNALVVLRTLLVDIAKRNDDGKGCLLVNTAVELGRHDANVARLTRAGFEAMADMFESVITAGQHAGSIRPGLDAARQARILVTGIAGLRVMVQSGFSAKEMQPFVDTLLDGMAV